MSSFYLLLFYLAADRSIRRTRRRHSELRGISGSRSATADDERMRSTEYNRPVSIRRILINCACTRVGSIVSIDDHVIVSLPLVHAPPITYTRRHRVGLLERWWANMMRLVITGQHCGLSRSGYTRRSLQLQAQTIAQTNVHVHSWVFSRKPRVHMHRPILGSTDMAE